MPLPFGEDAAVGSAVLRSGVSREVSAYSTECRKCALVAARWQPWKLRGSKPAFDQIPRSLRTALQQPPRPHPDCSRQVVLSRVSQIQTYQPPSDGLRLSPGGFARISLVQRQRSKNASPERKFDTESHYPYCYGSRPNNRLESTANVHTAADLHVRPVSKTALVSRSWAPRAVKEYTMDDFSQSI